MNFIRNLQFFGKGYFAYTKSDQPLPPIEGSLQNANYVITGANSGIGYEAATFAASKKAKVYMVCRNKEKGEKAVKQISQKTNNKQVYLILGELGEKKNLQQIVKQIKQKVGTIDILVHNAGCMNHQYHENRDAVQTNFATNVLSVYYLTKQLIPCLHQKSKVIVMSSGGMYNAPLITDDIYMRQKFDGTTQYARNKRMQVCMVQQFAKMYKDKGVFVTMHPGWVDTPGVRTQMPNFHKMLNNKLKTPQEGADTLNYLAMTPINNLKSGQFYYNRQIAAKHLPVSGTHYTQQEVNKLMFKLHQLTGL